jgi:hypothetical protein
VINTAVTHSHRRFFINRLLAPVPPCALLRVECMETVSKPWCGLKRLLTSCDGPAMY